MNEDFVKLGLSARALAGSSLWDACDLDALCSHFGIAVRRVRLQDIQGCLIREGEGFVAYINNADSPTRQRFTIAHEVAHFLIDGQHRLGMYLRALEGKLSGQLLETRCNQLAAEILMPTMGVASLIQRNVPSIEKIGELAETYNVSLESAALRLADLTEWPCKIAKWTAFGGGFERSWMKGPLSVTVPNKIAVGGTELGVSWAFHHDETVRRPECMPIRQELQSAMAESKGFGPTRRRYVLTIIVANEPPSSRANPPAIRLKRRVRRLGTKTSRRLSVTQAGK